MNQLNSNQNIVINQIASLKTASWKVQVDIIEGLKINQSLIKLINMRNYSLQFANLLVSGPNPRSKLITTICDFLINLFSKYSSKLMSFANMLITPQCLLRLLGNCNKTISSSINEVIKCIITHTDFTMRNKQLKYISHLQHSFLTSKNNYVKQKISMYFIVISDSDYYYSDSDTHLEEFKRKIVAKGLADSNKEVRNKMRLIEQNIQNKQKQNIMGHFNDKGNRFDKNVDKNDKIFQGNYPFMESLVAQNINTKNINKSSLNQSIIIDNFKQIQFDAPRKQVQSIEQNLKFYLQRMKNGDTWQIKLLSYDQIIIMLQLGELQKNQNKCLYVSVLKQIIPFISQKRSKMYIKSTNVFESIMEKMKKILPKELNEFMEENYILITEHSLKNEKVAINILTKILQLNPLLFLIKFAQLTMNIKAYKERLLLLDIILNNLCELDNQKQLKRNKKASIIVKFMCQHIDKASIKQKQLSLASLAIISHLKNKFSDDVLTILLCQNQKILNKIINLSSQIDQSLKISVINYINSLKSTDNKYDQIQQWANKKQKISLSDQIDREINLITLELSNSLNNLGQIVLKNIRYLSIDDFQKILILSQFLCEDDKILELRILLEEMSKLKTKKFIEALLALLQPQTTQDKHCKIRQNHDIMFLDILCSCIKHVKESSKIELSKYGASFPLQMACSLIKMYRNSGDSLKKRNIIICALMQFEDNLIQQCTNPKQLLLVQTYRLKMKSQKSMDLHTVQPKYI